MEEEISLREIIEKLWRGKWIIVGITIVALLISFVYSFFIANPVYKGNAKVTVHNVASVPETVQPYINEMTKPEVFEQTMKSTIVLEKLIKQENLDSTIGQLQDKINVELPNVQGEETNSFISISMEGTNREDIKAIIDGAISLTRDELGKNIQTRLTLLEEEYQSKMKEEDKQITKAVEEYNNLGAGEDLPTLILFQQNASGSEYVLEANEYLLNELNNLDKSEQVKYEKINRKINDLTSLYNFYSNKYDEVRSISTMNIVDISTNVLSDSFVPQSPISPSKVLNLAISIVLGLIVGVFVTLVRGYFSSDPSIDNNN
ncbi:Wzz/FepE/Etk N-terminal domain-containing protein [Virgibacillus salinus]|uniref:LPS O-antigen chain length determinant protein, WzzB/FepE family n=1 Tax=Virgibacillus salinus TaxID=553311 RepID=A0A1H0YIT0_9BACI|nr:Wzz/FepE/Etk N-terminal domain-containing protein [Virgibacillus salinus]SDQ14831.1 LPS O-antigen chain length determinant protein, WzzB/FepE family [Virgibacillus salinus]